MRYNEVEPVGSRARACGGRPQRMQTRGSVNKQQRRESSSNKHNYITHEKRESGVVTPKEKEELC